MKFLRRLAPAKWAVIIDTHVAPTPPADDDYDPYWDRPITGQRLLGDVVAIIVQVSPVDFPDVFDIYVDRGEVVKLAEVSGTCLRDLARRIGEGEFDDDCRFEYSENPEPSFPGDRFHITQYAIPSQRVVDSFTTHDPGDVIASCREAQTTTLEERFAVYADRGW